MKNNKILFEIAEGLEVFGSGTAWEASGDLRRRRQIARRFDTDFAQEGFLSFSGRWLLVTGHS
jgi:hypothetical protein